MAKGVSKSAQNLFGAEGSAATGQTQKEGADRATLFPFLTNEVTNPQGFGTDTLNQILTQGGEAAAGGTGAAAEAANLNASRTGNTAAVPGIIDATARNAMKQQSTNALDTNIQNAMLKQKQQQAGASGLSGLYSEDQNAALKAMGLQNETLGEWTKADQTGPGAQFMDPFLGALGSTLGKGIGSGTALAGL